MVSGVGETKVKLSEGAGVEMRKYKWREGEVEHELELVRVPGTGGTPFLFGGEVLRGFAFAMLVGIVTGTYSTVFVAAPIAALLAKKGRSPSQ